MKMEFFITVLLVMWPAALAQKGCQERCYASEEDWETKCAWTELCSACPRCDTSESPSVKISTATTTTEGSKSGDLTTTPTHLRTTQDATSDTTAIHTSSTREFSLHSVLEEHLGNPQIVLMGIVVGPIVFLIILTMITLVVCNLKMNIRKKNKKQSAGKRKQGTPDKKDIVNTEEFEKIVVPMSATAN